MSPRVQDGVAALHGCVRLGPQLGRGLGNVRVRNQPDAHPTTLEDGPAARPGAISRSGCRPGRRAPRSQSWASSAARPDGWTVRRRISPSPVATASSTSVPGGATASPGCTAATRMMKRSPSSVVHAPPTRIWRSMKAAGWDQSIWRSAGDQLACIGRLARLGLGRAEAPGERAREVLSSFLSKPVA